MTARPYFQSSHVTIWNADARTAAGLLEPDSVDAIVTSPPYFGLRDYGVNGQIGLEQSPDEYVDQLADLLTSYVDVLKPGGSLWLNLGDTYSSGASQPGWGEGGGSTLDGAKHTRHAKPVRGIADFPAKCLLMIPERVALALIARGWILRNRVVWHKPNGMPSSARDRLATKHEALFHLVRAQRYYYDLDAIRTEPVDNTGVWTAIRASAKRKAAEVGMTDEHEAALRRVSLRAIAKNAGTGTGQTRDARLSREPLAVEAVEKMGPTLASAWAFDGSAGVNPGDVWEIPTAKYPAAHFAVFPPELVRRPILATVPERVCRGCGTPRERIVEVETRPNRDLTGHPDSPYRGANVGRDRREREHVGWSDCGCDAGWTPGTVLDPFLGSGTTADMARRLGRKAVGVELSADYCRLAADRFAQPVLDLDEVSS